jgi:glyoxylase-like metal-dependent hydrolase (beta-lactamase superfamily II)
VSAISLTRVAPDVYLIPLGAVNAYLILTNHLTLIDTGPPGSEHQILGAVRVLGWQPASIRHILVTHCHPDHAGGLAAVKAATGAAAYMHAADAKMVRAGKGMRALTPSPGAVNHLLFRTFIGRLDGAIPAAEIDHEVRDREELEVAGGIRAIHAPGHCAGQVAFLRPHHGGVLFAGDACSNVLGLRLSLGYENLDEGRRTLTKLGRLDFDTACFGHGRPLKRGAGARFRAKWGAR